MIIDDVQGRTVVALESLSTYTEGYDHDGLKARAFITRSEVSRQRKLLDARTIMDRKPLPAPFAVGAVVRYLGPTLDGYGIAPMRRDALVQGAEYTIVRIARGARGDLTQADIVHVDKDSTELTTSSKAWWDDEHLVPMLNVTLDGYCALQGVRGRYITAANAHLWQSI